MYRREKSITLKGSASALSNNLSVRIDMARSTIHYAVVHRYTVNLVSASMNGQTVNSRQVVCKEPSVNYCSSIIQASAQYFFMAMLTFLWGKQPYLRCFMDHNFNCWQ